MARRSYGESWVSLRFKLCKIAVKIKNIAEILSQIQHDEVNVLKIPDSVPRSPQVSSSLKKQNLPEKVERSMVEGTPVERQRSNSMSSGSQPQTTRKRTSSGVFQVDEAEPPPKKCELVRSHSDSSRKKPEALPNGRRKTIDSESAPKREKGNIIEKEKIIDKFDVEAKSKCVSAFKESDTWD